VNIAMLSIHSSPTGEIGTIDTGGMSIYIRELAAELDQYGHHVDIFTCDGKNNQTSVTHITKKARLITLNPAVGKSLSKHNLFPCLPEICSMIERFTNEENKRYDVLHSHYWLSGCLGTQLRKKWQVPHIIMFHTLGKMQTQTGTGVKETTTRVNQEKTLVRDSQKIIAPTELERDNLINYYGTPPGKISVIPGGVNVDLFHPGNQGKARAELNIDTDGFILLYVGRFASLKKIDHLIKAIHLLEDRYEIKLILIGGDGKNDPKQKRLMELAVKLNIEKQVHFIGRVEHHNLPAYYNAADLFVLPSVYESFGLVCLEALACGTPVVASHVGVMASVLDNAENGITLNDTTPQNLAAAIRKFISKKRFDRISQENICSSVKDYSWKRIAAATINVYKKLSEQKKDMK
jgi:D-inositol-3-phosphate glycosyltransferase